MKHQREVTSFTILGSGIAPEVNRTERKRAAMLQAVIPMFIMPFMDTSRPYKDFIHSPLVEALTELERTELEAVMINKMVGPQGHLAITVDEELTERISVT